MNNSIGKELALLPGSRVTHSVRSNGRPQAISFAPATLATTFALALLTGCAIFRPASEADRWKYNPSAD